MTNPLSKLHIRHEEILMISNADRTMQARCPQMWKPHRAATGIIIVIHAGRLQRLKVNLTIVTIGSKSGVTVAAIIASIPA